MKNLVQFLTEKKHYSVDNDKKSADFLKLINAFINSIDGADKENIKQAKDFIERFKNDEVTSEVYDVISSTHFDTDFTADEDKLNYSFALIGTKKHHSSIYNINVNEIESVVFMHAGQDGTAYPAIIRRTPTDKSSGFNPGIVFFDHIFEQDLDGFKPKSVDLETVFIKTLSNISYLFMEKNNQIDDNKWTGLVWEYKDDID